MSLENLFEEPGLIQITCWARGVYENKDARDVVVSLSDAATLKGKHVQAYENYVDLPDRIYVSVRAYARISPNPIESKYVYENESPNIVVLTEETLVKGRNVLEGMQPGGVLVVNTRRSIDEIVKHVKKNPEYKNLATIAVVDASSLATNIITLSGAEGATDASGIGAGFGAALAGAVVKASGVVELEDLLSIVANKVAAQSGYDEATVVNTANLSVSA